jgi:sugar O-acyltransferase (sialic acid O-acetyltransferase NeuD family)
MLIAGTGGLGKEILEVLIEDGFTDEIVFYDEGTNAPDLLYNKFRVYKGIQEIKNYFTHGDKRFITGIGNPRIREKVSLKIEKAGGELFSVISKRTTIFPFNEKYSGIVIQPGVGISHDVTIGTGGAIHINSSVGHSSKIGKYVNIGPNATIIGPAVIGDYSYISAHAVILPNLSIGKNVIVTVGKIADKNLEDYEVF